MLCLFHEWKSYNFIKKLSESNTDHFSMLWATPLCQKQCFFPGVCHKSVRPENPQFLFTFCFRTCRLTSYRSSCLCRNSRQNFEFLTNKAALAFFPNHSKTSLKLFSSKLPVRDKLLLLVCWHAKFPQKWALHERVLCGDRFFKKMILCFGYVG